MQEKQTEWLDQWKIFEDAELFLFQDWIKPFTMEYFRDKAVLECGCGGGQHTTFMAPYAKQITAVDLNTAELVRKKHSTLKNVEFIEADIASMNLEKKFDIVISIGVVHHTDSPDKTVQNLISHLKPGGTLILWVYSQEGNELVENLVEPFRKRFLASKPLKKILFISKVVTSLLYFPVFTLYYLPLSTLPFYEYFGNFRKLSFERNMLNVFDKLNAPQVQFISKKRAESWVENLEQHKVLSYKKVSYSISGVKPKFY